MKKEDAYALEMQLQLKRAEREQRRVQLSVEFASTFADVSDKKRQLDRLSSAVADIEATRQRKSREFGHMQVFPGTRIRLIETFVFELSLIDRGKGHPTRGIRRQGGQFGKTQWTLSVVSPPIDSDRLHQYSF